MAKFKDYDDYIEQSEEFARPILSYIRECTHEACPEVEETFKWSFPNFVYKKNILSNMASFKGHASYGFWLASLMDDPNRIFSTESGMGQFGKLTSVDDLPDKVTMIKYIQHAMDLIDQGKKLPTKKAETKELKVPDILQKALTSNETARSVFDKFSPSNRKEYIEWIEEAKTDATKEKRTAQTIEWLEEGKPRNWKYMKKFNP